MSKVLLFIKSVDPLDREKVGLLLEADEGPTTDWVVVKGVCGRFNKWWEWNDEGSSMVGPTIRKKLEEIPTKSEETRRRLKSATTPTDMVKAPSKAGRMYHGI